MSATVTTRARNLRPELAQFEQFMRDYVKPPVGIPFQSLLTNGTFDVGVAGWVHPDGARGNVSHDTNRIKLDNDGTGNNFVYQPVQTEVGGVFKFSADATEAASTNVYVSAATPVGSGLAVDANAGASPELVFKAITKTTHINLLASGGTSASHFVTFDNVSLWEANPANDNPWLRLPYGKTVDEYGRVYRDGQRLMDGDFYLRKTGDPMQNFVEPLTPPGASTRFIVDCSEVRR